MGMSILVVVSSVASVSVYFTRLCNTTSYCINFAPWIYRCSVYRNLPSYAILPHYFIASEIQPLAAL